MNPYELLSKNYDQVFPVSAQEIAFIREHLSGKKRLLDIGCGTGSKTVELASSREAVGVDSSREMIELAQRLHSCPSVSYRVLGMLELSAAFPEKSFDSAVCLGNTLPHLSGPGQISDMLGQVNSLLLPGGVLIVQTINFDRIITEKIAALPTIETDAVIFRRSYEWRGSEMDFCIELEDRATGQTGRGRTPMLPVLKSDLENALRAAGFGRVDCYGSFSGEPYRGDSYHLIFKAVQVNA